MGAVTPRPGQTVLSWGKDRQGTRLGSLLPDRVLPKQALRAQNCRSPINLRPLQSLPFPKHQNQGQQQTPLGQWATSPCRSPITAEPSLTMLVSALSSLCPPHLSLPSPNKSWLELVKNLTNIHEDAGSIPDLAPISMVLTAYAGRLVSKMMMPRAEARIL